MSDCSLASGPEAVNSSGSVGDGVSQNRRPFHERTQDNRPTGCPQTQSMPNSLMKQGTNEPVIASSSSLPGVLKTFNPVVPQSLPPDRDRPDTPQPLKQSSSKSIPNGHSPIVHPPSSAVQPVVGSQSSSESICSTHSTDLVPHPPTNTPSDHSYPIRQPSLSQSHPNIRSSTHATPHPPSPQLLFAEQSFKSVGSPTLMPLDSRRSSSMSEMEGVVVYDITNTPKVVDRSVSACSQVKPVRTGQSGEVLVINAAPRKSLSQPTIVAPPGKVRRTKHHKFISPVLSVNNSSTDSLPSLAFSVVQPSSKEPKPKQRSKKGRNRVHPEWRPEIPAPTPPEEVPIIQSPSSTSGSSVASRNPSLLSESARSSVSLTLGPLLTSSLRIRQTRSTEGYLGGVGEIQLESCFPDRHIRLYVVTWNMQERKVGVVGMLQYIYIRVVCYPQTPLSLQ